MMKRLIILLVLATTVAGCIGTGGPNNNNNPGDTTSAGALAALKATAWFKENGGGTVNLLDATKTDNVWKYKFFVTDKQGKGNNINVYYGRDGAGYSVYLEDTKIG